MGLGPSSFAGLSVDQGIHIISCHLHDRGMGVYDAFKFLDRDQSGSVNWQEFYQAVSYCIADVQGNAPDTTALYAIFLQFDVNRDGNMDLQEFAAALDRDTHMERLAQSVMERIASSLVRTGHTPEQLFARLDRDKSGTLSRLEVEEVILGLQPDLTLSEREAVWNILDADKSGSIDVNEFHQRLQAINAAPLVALEEKIASLQRTFTDNGYGTYESFRVFDQNQDNHLDLEEWRLAMQSLVPQMSEPDVDAIFSRFDQNGDGFLSLTEFSQFYQDSFDRRPQLARDEDGWPVYTPPPVEVAWETEILDMVRDCLCPGRSGLQITEVFRRLDVDGNTVMTDYEFKRMITTYRPDLGPEHLDSLFSKVNISGSGSISMSEFVRRFG